MLGTLFLICAVVGGALVLAQLLMSAAAFGTGHGLHLHHGPHHGGGSARGVHPHRGGVRAHTPRGVKSSGTAKHPTPSNTAPDASAANVHHWGHWAMSWMAGMLNFQAVVCGVTVFGLAGLAACAARRSGPVSLELGIAAAVVMMALINGMLSMMTGLDRDGTVDLRQAVGQPATVYLGIPGNNRGRGKVTVTLQQRCMEFPAVTLKDDQLVTGQKVVIVAVLDPAVMLVVAADQYVPDPDASVNE